MSDEIKCPKCQSPAWDCWDERMETWEEIATGEYYEFPVGYMRCKDCGQGYTHYSDDLSGFRYADDESEEYE